MSDLDAALAACGRDIRAALAPALAGRDLDEAAAARIIEARGRDLTAVAAVADHLRRAQVGDDVGYVVNRNINFSNVCIKRCKFCAFSRDLRSGVGYLLPVEEVVRRAREARALGATEVCVQAGLVPSPRGRLYVDVARAIREAEPTLHLHAFSPEEVRYGAALARRTVREQLAALREAGVASLPGTSAEILDDALRERISPGRISTAAWIGVVREAHGLGLPTTATFMYGHAETPAQLARHLGILRAIQRETAGFTEVVPLGFVHAEAPLFATEEGVRPGATVEEHVAVHAVTRLFLGRDIPNLQVSWVKTGLSLAERLLAAGANDLGGTLMNESISTAAGAPHGQLVRPKDLRALARRAGRRPVERDTVYRVRRRFGDDPREDPPHPLDAVTDADARFGTFADLAGDARFRFRGALPR